MVSNYFLSPYMGKMSNLTSIFFKGVGSTTNPLATEVISPPKMWSLGPTLCFMKRPVQRSSPRRLSSSGRNSWSYDASGCNGWIGTNDALRWLAMILLKKAAGEEMVSFRWKGVFLCECDLFWFLSVFLNPIMGYVLFKVFLSSDQRFGILWSLLLRKLA